MAKELNKLKFGKGNVFVKSQLRRLRQEDENWEADFRALPKPITQSATHYLGMVLTQPDGFLRAHAGIEQSPNVNDLATLLAHAMMRPLVNSQCRPRRIHLRDNPNWKPLFPALKEIRIDVVIKTELVLKMLDRTQIGYDGTTDSRVPMGCTAYTGRAFLANGN
jgi:hypothetical protein